MQIPPALQQGDRVAIVATARKTSEDEMAPAIGILESWGLEVIVSPHLYAGSDQFAGSDSVRLDDLQEMLDDTSVKAIFCARGGYGTVRILQYIDWQPFQNNPKWIIGYSDVSALHSLVNHLGIASIHGTMPVNFEKNTPESLSALKNLLFGRRETIVTQPHPLNRAGSTTAVTGGGNLSIVYSLRGTPADFNPDGKILFIEDLDEYLYHVDRMMMNLCYSGILSRISGLIVGYFSDMHDNDIPFGKDAENIIADAVKAYHYPVAFGFPAGHNDHNMPILLGCPVKMEVSDRLALSYC